MSHATVVQSVMMQVSNIGAFVRVLLPVRLIGSHTVMFGAWLAMDLRKLGFVYDV